MTFDIKALDPFRHAKLQGADAIANVGKDNTVAVPNTMAYAMPGTRVD